jgi:hypothetical protein
VNVLNSRVHADVPRPVKMRRNFLTPPRVAGEDTVLPDIALLQMHMIFIPAAFCIIDHISLLPQDQSRTASCFRKSVNLPVYEKNSTTV